MNEQQMMLAEMLRQWQSRGLLDPQPMPMNGGLLGDVLARGRTRIPEQPIWMPTPTSGTRGYA